MNAAQSKNLINAARNVLAILPADTDQTLAQLLAAIEAAEAKPVAKKPAKPRKGDYPPNDPRRIGESPAEYFERVMRPFRITAHHAKALKLKQGREGDVIDYRESEAA